MARDLSLVESPLRWIPYGCPTCGGALSRRLEEREYRCLLCAREYVLEAGAVAPPPVVALPTPKAHPKVTSPELLALLGSS